MGLIMGNVRNTARNSRRNFRPEWMTKALCAGADVNVWFPANVKDIEAAKEICAKCPVIADCLDTAINDRIGYGIWGGKTADERKIIRAKRVRLSRIGI